MYDDLEEPEPTPGEDNFPESATWKEELRQQFESWLESIEEAPEIEERPEAPDLYSLYEELTALRSETRKGNRKSAEVFSRFSDSLGHFQEEIGQLSGQLNRIESAGNESAMPRSHFLALVEILDRMHRLELAFERAPRPSRFAFLNGDVPWRKAWANWQQGFSILVAHFENLLGQAGIKRLNTLGAAFDPTTMQAVATVPADGQPANVVVEEVASGFRWGDAVLRPAEVKITKSEL
jgi:molecular chaperone GrpE (heat shock protein)